MSFGICCETSLLFVVVANSSSRHTKRVYEIENLSNNAGSSGFSDIATSGNNVYVMCDDSSFGNVEILYRRSTDCGMTFGPTENQLTVDQTLTIRLTLATSRETKANQI
ncbi:MAG TPA: hypothetical protein VE378_03940 [Nitrososphaeraceae archaeon]|nr:hypothetical protein [Nitrososphaeraceae archaeon]